MLQFQGTKHSAALRSSGAFGDAKHPGQGADRGQFSHGTKEIGTETIDSYRAAR